MRRDELDTCLRVLRENLAEVDERLASAPRDEALHRHRGDIEKALHVLERSRP